MTTRAETITPIADDHEGGRTSVNAGPPDVSAAKGDTFTSIAHLDLGGNRYFEMVMTGGESSAPGTGGQPREIVQLLAGIGSQ